MQPTTTDRKVLDDTGFNELTISVSANNKVNLGNYESADRTVFLEKKLRLAADATMQEEHAIFENETRRLQSLADCELARITAVFCNEVDAQLHRDNGRNLHQDPQGVLDQGQVASASRSRRSSRRATTCRQGREGRRLHREGNWRRAGVNGKAYVPAPPNAEIIPELTIGFRFDLEPRGKGRPRLEEEARTPSRRRSHGRRISCSCRPERSDLRREIAAMNGMPLHVELELYYKKPKKGEWFCTSPVDNDNAEKNVWDAMQGVFFKNDNRIIANATFKTWSEGEPYVKVRVAALRRKAS
jgi:Holliday junction resolvase RusA-like endonuclease